MSIYFPNKMTSPNHMFTQRLLLNHIFHRQIKPFAWIQLHSEHTASQQILWLQNTAYESLYESNEKNQGFFYYI